MSDKENRELVCGVEKEIVERFLVLIRDKYPLVAKATYFIEAEVGASNISSITNTRDVLSHLVTLLKKESSETNEAQYANAEEHLRRAVMEPYERAVAHIGVQVADLYEEYKGCVIPIKDKNVLFTSAPDQTSVETRLEKVKGLRVEGREGKSENRWSERWEIGIQNLIQAFGELKSLRSELEEALNKYHNLRTERKSKIYFWWAMTATVVMGILSIVISIILSK